MKKPTGRAGKEAWFDAGFALLRDGGESALTIERLCEVVGRTKGSFYHHFSDMPSFAQQLLQTWQRRHTEAPIERSTSEAPKDRRRALEAAVGGLDHHLELSLRAWGDKSHAARAACAAVDERRIEYLTALWEIEGKPAKLARTLANIEYAAFVGFLSVFGPLRDKRRAEHALLVRALAGMTMSCC